MNPVIISKYRKRMRNEHFRILKSQLLPMAAGPGVLLFFLSDGFISVYSDVFGQSFYFLPDNRRMIFGQAARFWGTANVTPKRTESRGLGVEDPQELSLLFLSGFHAARVHVQIDRCPFFMRLSVYQQLKGNFITADIWSGLLSADQYRGNNSINDQSCHQNSFQNQ